MSLPSLKERKTLLYLLAIGNTVAFVTWQVLLNNFVVEQAAFSGEENGSEGKKAWHFTQAFLPSLPFW